MGHMPKACLQSYLHSVVFFISGLAGSMDLPKRGTLHFFGFLTHPISRGLQCKMYKIMQKIAKITRKQQPPGRRIPYLYYNCIDLLNQSVFDSKGLIRHIKMKTVKQELILVDNEKKVYLCFIVKSSSKSPQCLAKRTFEDALVDGTVKRYYFYQLESYLTVAEQKVQSQVINYN